MSAAGINHGAALPHARGRHKLEGLSAPTPDDVALLIRTSKWTVRRANLVRKNLVSKGFDESLRSS